MTTFDAQIILAAVTGIILGIWIGCKFMEHIYNRDLTQMANQILELEKELCNGK